MQQTSNTYRASAPPSTHFRPATCAEVDCTHYLGGWQTILADNDKDNAAWIRNYSGLQFTESRSDGTVAFTFAPGQPCCRRNAPRISLERPSIFTVNSGLGFSRREPDQWVDEMGEQLEKLEG